MAALLGLKSADQENPKGLVFLSTDTRPGVKLDGLVEKENGAELFDPWGNPYRVVINFDFDNQLRPLPFQPDLVFFDRWAAAWSAGPDGKFGTPETDEDNIYSWDRK